MIYLVSLYDETSDGTLGRFNLPSLPPVGTVIVWPVPGRSATWRVKAVQVIPQDPDSLAARDRDPVLVDVIAVACGGIHHAA